MELIDFDALLACLKQDDMVFMLDHSDEMTQEQLKALQPLDNTNAYPAIAYLTHEATALKKQIYIDNWVVCRPIRARLNWTEADTQQLVVAQ